MAGDEAANEEHAQVVEDKVAAGEAGDVPAHRLAGAGPHEGHGDGDDDVGHDPDDSAGTIRDAVLKVDAKQRLPFADRGGHFWRLLSERKVAVGKS